MRRSASAPGSASSWRSTSGSSSGRTRRSRSASWTPTRPPSPRRRARPCSPRASIPCCRSPCSSAWCPCRTISTDRRRGLRMKKAGEKPSPRPFISWCLPSDRPVPGAALLEALPGLLERNEVEILHRPVFGVVVPAEAELHAMALLGLGDVEGAEQPVPDGELGAEIAVPVMGVGAVMDLVHGRADEDPRQHRPEAEPDMGMAQMGPADVEQHAADIDAEDGDGAELLGE